MTLQAQMEARAAFYKARAEYAAALGGGTATAEQHRELLALKAAYEATA